MSDSTRIQTALITKLTGDPQLAALMPDGVYQDIAAKNKTRFVIVSLMSGLDTPMLGARAYETCVYLVKAVELATAGANINAASVRIDALLDYGVLLITGYDFMTMRRVERISMTEVDEESDARWQHRGGLYEIVASPS